MVIQPVAARHHCHKSQVHHHPHSFVSNPKVQPVQHKASMLAGVSVTFNSATTISIKQGDADSIIRLVNLYERKNGESCIL